MKTLIILKLIRYENTNLPNSIIGSYHSGNGKRPNTRQPNQ